MALLTDQQTTATAEDIISALRAGHHPDPGRPLDLRGANLAGFNLSGLNLTNADLTGADLNGADLSGAMLMGAKLSQARLFAANLSGAHLNGAQLVNAELSGANLAGANLENANALRAGFGMANLTGANLERACLDEATLSGAALSGAQLGNASLKQARLRDANLTGADFSGADLHGAHLSLSRVDRAVFRNADLGEARMRMVRGYETADWIGSDIRDVSFAGSLMLRRFILDQNYIMEYRHSSRLAGWLYYPWLVTSDCGRSLPRWCGLIGLITLIFALVYQQVGIDFGPNATWFSPYYFSVVTITTLGYGDVLPTTVGGQMAAVAEVALGYMMLGGLLAIFSNKIARRAE